MKPGHIVGRECNQSSGLRPYTYELRSTYCMIHRVIHCVIIIRVALVMRLPSMISYSRHNSLKVAEGLYLRWQTVVQHENAGK